MYDSNIMWSSHTFFKIGKLNTCYFSFFLQQVCEEWSKKPEEDKEFEPFFRTVSAVAYSSGTRLRTRVQILNSVNNIFQLNVKISLWYTNYDAI